MRKNDGSGCAGIFFIICILIYFLYQGCDHLLHGDERAATELLKKQKKENEFLNYWKSENIEYLKNFKCSEFHVSNRMVEISKFYSIITFKDFKCKMEDFRKLPDTLDFKNNRLAEYISDANVLIWIKQVPGEKVGGYEDGSRAIRIDSEINFIELKTKSIYKQVTVEGVGMPQSEIRKKGYTSPTIDVFYGAPNYLQIQKVIEKELR